MDPLIALMLILMLLMSSLFLVTERPCADEFFLDSSNAVKDNKASVSVETAEGEEKTDVTDDLKNLVLSTPESKYN